MILYSSPSWCSGFFCGAYGPKIDVSIATPFEIFKKKINGRKKVFTVSAINGEGLEKVVQAIIEMLKDMPKPTPIEHEEFKYEKVDVRKFEIVYSEEDNVYIVDGPIVKLLERNVVLNDMDSLAYMQKTLKEYGVITALRKAGCKDNDTVVIGDIEFIFMD